MDYYRTLGVPATASAEDIKKAYRKLAMLHHPDRGGDTEKFKEISEAYDVLSDDNKKRQYDHRSWGQWNREDAPDPFSQASPYFGDFANIFRERSEVFRDKMQAQKNPDGIVDTTITLAQAYTGSDLNVNVGYANEIVTIPAGVRDGAKIRLKGKGPARIRSAPPGDLIIRINIDYPKDVARDQDDLYIRLDVDAISAMTGTNLEFNHVSGKLLSIKIPQGVSPGAKLRLAGWGMPNPQTRQPGNLYALIQLTVPKVTDPKHIELLNIISREVNKTQ